MALVAAQTGISFGRQLFFFLFLLVPGYFAVRAYYWANVALESNDRVNRLVLMAIGGFASLALVALWRRLVPTVQVYCLAFLSPEWLVVDGPLSVQTISELTILESLNLIVSQTVIAVFAAYLLGTLRHVIYDRRQRDHVDLERPWEQVVDKAGKGDAIEAITTDGKRIVGEVEALGSATRDYDVLLANVRQDSRDSTVQRSRESDLAYFYHDDLSRLLLRQVDTSTDTPWLQEQHERVTDWLDKWFLSDSKPMGDETETDPGDSFDVGPERDGENE